VAAQRLAAAASASAGRSLSAISSIAAGGKFQGKALRDLRRKCQAASLLDLRPTYVSLPVRKRKTRQAEIVQYPALAPHEYWAALHKVGLLESVLVGDGMRPDVFWQGVQSEEWFQRHPDLKVHERLPFTIPIRVHGDEGTGQKKKGILVMQWQGCLRHASTLESKFLITTMPTRLYVKQNKVNVTLEALNKFIAWSINQMSTGLWATSGEARHLNTLKAGCELAGPWRAVFAGLKGDWKFVKEATRCARGPSSRLVCPECFASSTDDMFNYADTRADAPWRMTRVRHDHWEENTPADARPSISHIRGWHVSLVYWDLLHMLFLGVGQDFVGSALVVMCREKHFGDHAMNVGLEEALCRHQTWLEASGFPANSPNP
jgi:hypothetical protein